MSNAPVVFRDMLRDLVACEDYPRFCDALQLIPAGPEVDGMEHDNSHARIEALMDIADEITESANVAADVIWSIFSVTIEEPGDRHLFRAIANGACLAVLSRLVDAQTLIIP